MFYLIRRKFFGCLYWYIDEICRQIDIVIYIKASTCSIQFAKCCINVNWQLRCSINLESLIELFQTIYDLTFTLALWRHYLKVIQRWIDILWGRKAYFTFCWFYTLIKRKLDLKYDACLGTFLMKTALKTKRWYVNFNFFNENEKILWKNERWLIELESLEKVWKKEEMNVFFLKL